MAIKMTHGNSDFFVGDTVKVNYKIKEKDGKDRIQAFDGVIISIKGTRPNQNFIVQKKGTDSVLIERIFPLNSPWIESIKKMRSPKRKIVRAKLFFLRDSHARGV